MTPRPTLLTSCLIFLFLFSVQPASAVFEMNANCTRAYQEIMALRFNKAEQLIQAEKKTNPSNDAVLFLSHKLLFLKAFISETAHDFELLKKEKDASLAVLEQGDKQNPYYRLSQAEILLETAVVKIKFREFLSAAMEIRKAYRLLEKNLQEFPAFKASLKGMGVLHALVGAVPDNYHWIVNMVGMEGNIRQGIGELKSILQISETDPAYAWLHDETLFMLIFTQYHLLKDDATTNKFIGMIDLKSASPLFYFIIANYYNSSGQSEKTLTLFESRIEDPETFPMPYLHFIRGSAMLFDLDAGSEKYFNRYIETFKGQNFIRAARQKIAWSNFISGDTAGYFDQLRQIRQAGNDFTDEDKHAMKEAELNEMPNLYLLRSRLLFDGGYYQRSLLSLSGKKIQDYPRLKDQLELTYRMGRIYDKTGQKDKAKGYYESTYENGRLQTWYYAANAALNLAMIYEEEGNAEQAMNYYKKCLALRNHEYQNSIDQKAEAGVNRLEKK